ncbi:MAG: response regulator transcription factor [Gammaproteobacteria bacterium]
MTEQKVYIIDDDEAVRDSIKELIESISLNAEIFESAVSFLDSFTTDKAGCIVLDIRMTKMSGLVLQERLNEMGATLPVIFITGHGDVDMAIKALKSGAVDFIQKPYHDQNLLDSINDALELDNRNRNVFQHEETMGKCIEKLTKREHQVMDLLSQGHTNKMIGKSLDISPRTVEVHRQHILQKFNVKSVTQLMYLLNRSAS